MNKVFKSLLILAVSATGFTGCQKCNCEDQAGPAQSPMDGMKEIKSAQLKRRVLTLDLKKDEAKMAEYKKYHEKIWPEITEGLHKAGVSDMEIYLFDNRMTMIIEYPDSVDLDARFAEMNKNPKNKEWEELMWNYQQSVPGSKPGEKWVGMEQIFKMEPRP